MPRLHISNEFEKLAYLYELHIVKEKLKLFEKKIRKKTFSEFEKEVLSKEDFAKRDDYLEWKAYLKSFKELQKIAW